MRSRNRAALAAVVFLLAGCGQVEQLKQRMNESGAQDKAKARVTGVLDGVQKGGTDTTPDVQRAICLWYNGSVFLEMGTLSKASDLFLSWQNEGRIARHISSFHVTGAETLAGGAVAVSGDIENQPFTVRVEPGVALAWIKRPQG